MKIKSIVLAVASTLSMSALADNASVDSAEIQKAIQLLENKGYQIDSPNEAKKSPPPGVQLKNYQLGKLDAFVSGSFGRSRYKLDSSSDEIFYNNNNKVTDDSYNLRGSFAYQDPSNLGFQFDGLYSQNQIKYAKISTVDLAGHAFYRNEKFLLGMFGQYKNPKLHFKDGDGSADGFIKDAILDTAFAKEQVFWGGEAQGYFGDLTLTGQLARQHFINKDQSIDNIYGKGVVATAKADYFINENWKLTGGYNHNRVDLSADTKYKIHKFSIGTEYQLTNYPVSFFGDFTHNKLKFDGDYGDCGSCYAPSQRNETLMVGIKYNFGGNSLKSRDRSGASLDPITTNGILDFIGQTFGSINPVP